MFSEKIRGIAIFRPSLDYNLGTFCPSPDYTSVIFSSMYIIQRLEFESESRDVYSKNLHTTVRTIAIECVNLKRDTR